MIKNDWEKTVPVKDKTKAPSNSPAPGFINLPSGPEINLTLETLGAGEDIAKLPARKKQVDKRQDISVWENDTSPRRQVLYTKKNQEITIEISDIDKISGTNAAAKKIFVLALSEANTQAVHNGEVTKDAISFPLSKLVDLGMYKNEKTARVGFEKGMDTLTSIKLYGKKTRGKSSKETSSAIAVLFTAAGIKNNVCKIFLNPQVNWDVLFEFFTILPETYFSLSNRASDLLLYIFTLARQHLEDIQQQGFFRISLRAIQHRLQLPTEEKNTHPYQLIKNEIDKALEEIEEAHNAQYNNDHFQLELVVDDNAPIGEYLDHGYLKVYLREEFAQKFVELNTKIERKIEAKERRKEKIIIAASALKAAKAEAK